MAYCMHCGDSTGGYVPMCNACAVADPRPAKKIYPKCVNCHGPIENVASKYHPDVGLCSKSCGFNLAIRIMNNVPGVLDLLTSTCGDGLSVDRGGCLRDPGHDGIHRNSFCEWGK